jgi:threonine/homoserine/homoserine lactone efflux protein
MTMDLFATGIALGIVVSIPPGPNTVLCIDLARGGVRRAAPLITGAALTDALYSLLAASGVMILARASGQALTLLAPCFAIAAAVLLCSQSAISPRAALGIAVLNPATAAVWLSLSSNPVLRAGSGPDVLFLPLPVALGTAAWFTALAVTTAKLSLHVTPRLARRIRLLLAASLVVIGLLTVSTGIG